jgi:hypothetical protein
MRQRNRMRWLGLVFILWVSSGAALRGQTGLGDAAAKEQWIAFLQTARIGESVQLGGVDAITNPWKLALSKDGVSRFGLWKDIDSIEDKPDRWRYEVAAYRIDVLLGLDMVPPTVERRFQGRPGSIQLWMDGTESLKARTARGAGIPEAGREEWNRRAFLQRAFDSLIANEDRNANNILVDGQVRVMLIDHSRAFRTAKPFSERLVFGAAGLTRAPDGTPYPFPKLPRAFVAKLRALDAKSLRAGLKGVLVGKEIEVLLHRRDLIIEEVEALVRERGEAEVLY